MIIRKATAADAAPIAGCLLLAMKDIVYHFIGTRDAAEAEAFMLYFVRQQNNQYAYPNCTVAEVNGTVAGAINVYNGALLPQLRAPVLAHIREHYQPGFVPEDETGPGEFYIDTLGVQPAYQGKGIGAALLRAVIHEVAQQQRQPLGLLVDDTNPGAKRLYGKLGFTSTGRRLLFGKPMEHLQFRPQ